MVSFGFHELHKWEVFCHYRVSVFLLEICEKLEDDLASIPSEPTTAMAYSHDVLLADMDAARAIADKLEELTAKEYWPFPVYADLLFSV